MRDHYKVASTSNVSHYFDVKRVIDLILARNQLKPRDRFEFRCTHDESKERLK